MRRQLVDSEKVYNTLGGAIYKKFGILFYPSYTCANMHQPLDVDKILNGVYEGSPIPEASRAALRSTAKSCPKYARGLISVLDDFIGAPTEKR